MVRRIILVLIISFLAAQSINAPLYAKPIQKLILVLDWFTNPNHAPIFIAKEQGFFQRNGLDVDIIVPADPTDPPKWVATGRADLALDYQPHVIMEIQRGLPIIQVGTLIDKPLNCLVVLASSPIYKLEDLHGKRIAYSSPEIDLLILKAMLKQRAISLNQVATINVHYDLVQALLSGKVDAAIGMMRNLELIQLQMLKKPGRAFYPEDYGVPSYSELVFIARQNQKKGIYSHFFIALDQAREYLVRQPEQSWQQFIGYHPELNTPLNKAVWMNTVHDFATKTGAINKLQAHQLSAFLSSIEK